MGELQSDLRQVHRSCPHTTTLSDRKQIRLRRERQARGRRAAARDGLERRATAPGGGLYSELFYRTTNTPCSKRRSRE